MQTIHMKSHALLSLENKKKYIFQSAVCFSYGKRFKGSSYCIAPDAFFSSKK